MIIKASVKKTCIMDIEKCVIEETGDGLVEIMKKEGTHSSNVKGKRR